MRVSKREMNGKGEKGGGCSDEPLERRRRKKQTRAARFSKPPKEQEVGVTP